MRVFVKLFATLSQYSPGGTPGTQFEIELEKGFSLQDLVNQLGIPGEETRIAFVNGVIQPMDWILKAGDEVGIFPPIGGG